MMRRKTSLGIVAVVLLIGGCQGAPETPVDRTTINMLMAEDWGGTPPIVDAVRDFERDNPDVRVNITMLPFNEVPEILASDTEGAPSFELVHWHAFAAGSRGIAEPVGDLWAEHGLTEEEYFPGALDLVTWEGTRYGVPLDVNALMLIVNPDLLAEIGVEDPAAELATFDDLTDVAERFREETGSEAMMLSASTWRGHGWIRTNGGRLVTVDEGGTARVTLDDPPAVEAMRFAGELVAAGLAHPPAVVGHTGNPMSLYQSGSVAMLDTGTWDTTTLDQDPDGPDYLALPLPTGPSAGEDRGTALGGSSLWIPRGAEHRELAFALAVHLTSDEYLLRYAAEEGRMPPRNHLYDDPLFDSDVHRTLRGELEVASAELLLAFPEGLAQYFRSLRLILSDGLDAAEVLERAQQAARDAGEAGS